MRDHSRLLLQVKRAASTLSGERIESHPSSKQRTGEPSNLEVQHISTSEATAGCDHGQASAGSQEIPVLSNAPFSLMWVRNLGTDIGYNRGALGVQLKDLVSGNIHTAFVSNYMIDFPWLLSSCPELHRVQNLIVVHGEQGSQASSIRDSVQQMRLEHAVVHAPPLPVMYGTHHSKAFVLG